MTYQFRKQIHRLPGKALLLKFLPVPKGTLPLIMVPSTALYRKSRRAQDETSPTFRAVKRGPAACWSLPYFL